jgi:site-specific DNA recombinase
MTQCNTRAAIYARVSSDSQAKDGTIASQLEALIGRVEHDDLRLETELHFVDDGYSGSTLVRPALERLRDLASVGGIDRLYIHSPDRLARAYVYQMLLVDELQQCGVDKVDPILWTKNERSFATPMQVCLTRNIVIALASSTPLRYRPRAG